MPVRLSAVLPFYLPIWFISRLASACFLRDGVIFAGLCISPVYIEAGLCLLKHLAVLCSYYGEEAICEVYVVIIVVVFF